MNLLLPTLLGYNGGSDWFWVSPGFIIMAFDVLIGRLDFHSIIITLPVLMFIYAHNYCTYLLHIVPDKDAFKDFFV